MVKVFLLVSMALSGCVSPVLQSYEIGGATANVAFIRRINEGETYRIVVYHGGEWYEVFRGYQKRERSQ